MRFIGILRFLILVILLLVTSASSAAAPLNSVEPFIGSPLCPTHDSTVFHTLWNSEEGCHYDHEHGTNPFTPETELVFAGIQDFIGGVQIGHTNPSSPIENTVKHGGFKWHVMLSNPHGCVGGFEGAAYCISSAVIQYHNFGDYSHEMEHSIHSAVAFLTVCDPALPLDCGELRTAQHLEFGQRIVPYQGTVIPYPNNFVPAYPSQSGQYFSIGCIDPILPVVPQCRKDIPFIVSRKINADSIWTSKITSTQPNPIRPPGSTILKILFRVRDTYQVFDWNDFEYPFTFRWICGDSSYNPAGCRYTNSTSNIHEVAGTIPTTWDNLEGFDLNLLPGRITADGFTDRFGTLDLTCTEANETCFPIKMTNMFVGNYGDYLTAVKVSNTNPTSNPSRNIWFCGASQCSETTPNSVPSGWIGNEN
jgi:hypothetical protein